MLQQLSVKYQGRLMVEAAASHFWQQPEAGILMEFPKQ